MSTHNAFDTAFADDDRPWIEANAQGVLAVILLCRIAYAFRLADHPFNPAPLDVGPAVYPADS